MQTKMEKMKERLDKIEDALETKVESEELQTLRELVLRLPDVVEVDRLRAFVSSNIESYREDNFQFNKDF
jgi:hypothetical protein